MDNDDELIRRCTADPEAFRELVERFQAKIYSFLIHLAGRQAAEDLFQEVWLKVFKNASSYEPRGKAVSWLFKIANNLALDDRAKWTRGGDSIDVEVAAAWLSDPAPGPQSTAENNEKRVRLAAALNELPIEQRQIFLMREYGEMSFKEIAESLDIPLGTALSRMNYALGKLRSALEEYHA